MANISKKELKEYKAEYARWLNILTHYHARFTDNYQRYTAYTTTSGTDSKISDPVATELVERVDQKLFEKDPKFFAESGGGNIPKEVKNVIASVADFLWTNQDMVQSTGPMRQKLKVGGRELCITGNLGTEAYYNNEAKAPDFRITPIEDIIFDPTKTLKTSPVYYIRQFVSLDYLKENVEIKKDNEVVTGIFDSASIKKLERLRKTKNEPQSDSERQDPTTNPVNRSGSQFNNYVDDFQLISRWQGKKCCRFVLEDDEEILIQNYENEVLGTHPFQFAMDMEVVKEPYGFSFLDALNGLIRAKDLILNQVVDYGAKVLNPPTIVNPALGPVNLKTIANMYKLGGIVIGDPNAIAQKPVANLGSFGFDLLGYIEQRAEGVTGINSYTSGTPNSSVDKTQGTKGGIEALQAAGTSPITDRQQNIEESIIEPMINKMLKMIGATMADDEFKWVLVTGEKPEWIKVTRGFLTGKIKVIDLMQANLLDNDGELQNIVDLMMSEGKDPEKDVVFDIDWLIKVETGSLAERDAQSEVAKKREVIELGVGLAVPLDTEKLWKDIAMDSGIKEPEQFIKKEVPQNGQNSQGQPGIPAEGVGQAEQAPIGARVPGGVQGVAGPSVPARVG